MIDIGSTEQGGKGVSRSSEITPSTEHDAKGKAGNGRGLLHRFTNRATTDSSETHDARKLAGVRNALTWLVQKTGGEDQQRKTLTPKAKEVDEESSPEITRKIIANDIGNNDQQIMVDIISSTELHLISRDQKHVLKAKIDGKPVDLLQRRTFKKKAWLAFREAGLRVPPDLLEAFIDGEKKYLVTDVKADGSEAYGRDLENRLHNGDPRDRAPDPSVDKHFLRLTSPNNIHEIEGSVREFSDLATERGFELPFDDPFELLVHPDGTWDLITLDLQEARIGVDHGTAARENSESTDRFLKYLTNIRELMESKNKPTKSRFTLRGLWGK